MDRLETNGDTAPLPAGSQADPQTVGDDAPSATAAEVIAGRAHRAIDREYFRVRPAVYWRDLLPAMAAFVASFAWALSVDGPMRIIAVVVAAVSVHRAGVFAHELSHRYDTPNLQIFNLFWDLTVGALILIPIARFVKPHRTHHAVGTFRTADDPQYLPLRSDRRLAVFVLVFIPFLMPLVQAAFAVGASITGDRAEAAVERFANRHGMTTGAVLMRRHKRRVMWLSRYYVAVWALYVYLAPETLGLMYAVHVGGWYLATLRIPLEHRMESLLPHSDRRDHIVDSFTIESPFAELLQPFALKYHTAHHMYPGVPYHNLAALHRELKATDSGYRDSVVAFWDVVRGAVPEPQRIGS